MSDIPERALKRADELRHSTETYHAAFARYIEQHEAPPRDKLRWILDTAGYENGFHISQDFVDAVRTLLPADAISAIEQPPRDKLLEVADRLVQSYDGLHMDWLAEAMADSLRQALPQAALDAIEEMDGE
jgi:hypothetical protein